MFTLGVVVMPYLDTLESRSNPGSCLQISPNRQFRKALVLVLHSPH